MNEDYAEKVIEILCKEIDSLKKEIEHLKSIKLNDATNYITEDGTWYVKPYTGQYRTWHGVICPTCGSEPCRCGCFGTGATL